MDYKDIVNIVKFIRKYQELSGSKGKIKKIVLDYLSRFPSDHLKFYNQNEGLIVYIPCDVGIKVIAYQVEVDALPFYEKYNVEYKSIEKGIMVSHGNEIHLAVALGLMCEILTYKFSSNFCFIFESSKKGINNIRELLKGSILNIINIDEVYAMHIDPKLYTNQVIVQGGYLFACTEIIDISINRKDNYINFLSDDVNVLMITSEFIKNIQSIIDSKESKFLVTFNGDNSVDYENTNVHTKFIQGMIRSIDSQGIDMFKLKINNIRIKFEKNYKCKINIDYSNNYPPVINDYFLAEKFLNHIKSYQSYEVITKEPYMYSDDFGFFTEKYKGLMLMIGAESIFPYLHETMLPKELIIKKIIDTFVSYFYDYNSN